MIHRTIFFGSAATLLPSTALAHGGHLGEFAGHAHWIGVVAVAGAALVAGLVSMKDKKQKNAEETPEAGMNEETPSETTR